MGSGFSGKYHGTWSSPEGEELRARVLEAFEAAGGMLVGDSVVDLAEALARIAAGESADEVESPRCRMSRSTWLSMRYLLSCLEEPQRRAR